MRPVLLAITLSACASVPQTAENFRLAGCWANRSQPQIQSMVWRENAGALEGELVAFAEGEPASVRNAFTLTQTADGWRLCEPTAEGQPCWLVAHGSTGSLEGGRAFIDRFSDRLRIGVVAADGGERKIFEGVREDCPA
ncbi:MAG: hypothetical protein NW206_16170 [Hyphomonadaceae bacterium]|nr:hypothetical protein [Hyphomonadaceae bacterium]